jgi:hypothetical protein
MALPNNPRALSQIAESEILGVPDSILSNVTVQSITLTESLLTPGLQTSIVLHAYLHNAIPRNWDILKNKIYNLEIVRPILADADLDDTLKVSARIYRMSNRKLVNDNTEALTLHLCDDSLLIDAMHLVSKSWKCTTPGVVVDDVLQDCLGVEPDKIKIIPAPGPARDYIAQNIHPFQVLSQQATVALDDEDPSYVHYMTYEDMDFGDPRGTHYFRSLADMARFDPYVEFKYGPVTGSAYDNPSSILTYNFPCDFDLLSDVLNGVGFDGEDFSSLIVLNPAIKLASVVGNDTMGCGFGMGPIKTALSNIVSAVNQDSCPVDVESYMLLRQARMNLLEQDKVALRCTVPWRPELHVGMKIRVILPMKGYQDQLGPDGGQIVGELYGSGVYIISSLTHNIIRSGYSTTTMDCIAQTAGFRGEV